MIVDTNTGYHCATHKDYKNLMSVLEINGYTWATGEKLTKNDVYPIFGDKTLILIRGNHTVAFGHRDNYDRSRIYQWIEDKPQCPNCGSTIFLTNFFGTENHFCGYCGARVKEEENIEEEN